MQTDGTVTVNPGSEHAHPLDYMHAEKGLWSWLTTTDHKRIALLYLSMIVVFFFFGAAMALLMRLELLFPGEDYFSNDVYNRILTLHGITMIFLFIIPGIPAVFGNFFLPIMIGANDVSFPRINLASWYFYVAGGFFALISVALGGADTGWTFYVPYSQATDANVFFPIVAAFILGWSSILTGLNFIVTVHRLRAKNMDWSKLPLFVWALYATAWIQIVATPVVGITLLLILMEKLLKLPIFDPSIGGDPVLYQHLFWIYSHPAVYIMVLPAMGIVSEIIPVFSRKTIFGYKYIAFSSLAIASIGSLVWAHHMFTSGMADAARIIFSFLTFFVAIPSAIKVFNWLATMHRGAIRLGIPFLFCLSFILLFTIGGLTGLIQGALSADVHLHDTSFIVAHFHYTMFGGTGSMFFGGLYYWFPKMFGRLYNGSVALLGFVGFFVGFNLLYFPLFIAGFLGMPRRYADYLPEYTIYHQISTVGSWIVVASMLILTANLIYAFFRGRKAPINPWGGATLEWTVPSPPPTQQFPEPVTLERGPYDYTNIEPTV